MAKKDKGSGIENRSQTPRRSDPERRTSMLDWRAPVSIDGQPPIQRRSGLERRTEADRRRVVKEEPLAAPVRALVFPGQGSQMVGMGREIGNAFAVARAVFQEVDDALSQNLTRLMAEGPEEELRLTENAQPALMAVSLAVMRVLESESGLQIGDFCDLVAGHSLGEYSALTAARSISVADCACLLKTRGRAMQNAVPVGEGAMAALIGLEIAAAREIAAEVSRDGAICAAANDNGPGQVVVSGAKAAVERAIEVASTRGAKRGVLLPVSAPFHCSLMAPAATAMAEVLAKVTIRSPVVPLVSNVTARQVTDPAAISRLLVEQVTHTVRWRESVHHMKTQGINSLIEIGCGKVLSGLVRRIDRALSVHAVGTPNDIEVLLESLVA